MQSAHDKGKGEMKRVGTNGRAPQRCVPAGTFSLLRFDQRASRLLTLSSANADDESGARFQPRARLRRGPADAGARRWRSRRATCSSGPCLEGPMAVDRSPDTHPQAASSTLHRSYSRCQPLRSSLPSERCGAGIAQPWPGPCSRSSSCAECLRFSSSRSSSSFTGATSSRWARNLRVVSIAAIIDEREPGRCP